MTDKLSGIKPGDRVRVTFEGTHNGEHGIWLDGGKKTTQFAPAEISHPSFQIERIEPPLKVGDRVKNKDFPGPIWEVLALRDGYAVVYHVGTSRVVCPSDLERIA